MNGLFSMPGCLHAVSPKADQGTCMLLYAEDTTAHYPAVWHAESMLCDKTSRTRTAATQGWEAVQHSSITPGLIITILSAHQRLIWLHVSCEAVMSGAQKRRQAWPEDMWTGFTHIVVSYKIPLRTCSASAREAVLHYSSKPRTSLTSYLWTGLPGSCSHYCWLSPAHCSKASECALLASAHSLTPSALLSHPIERPAPCVVHPSRLELPALLCTATQDPPLPRCSAQGRLPRALPHALQLARLSELARVQCEHCQMPATASISSCALLVAATQDRQRASGTACRAVRG